MDQITNFSRLRIHRETDEAVIYHGVILRRICEEMYRGHICVFVFGKSKCLCTGALFLLPLFSPLLLFSFPFMEFRWYNRESPFAYHSCKAYTGDILIITRKQARERCVLEAKATPSYFCLVQLVPQCSSAQALQCNPIHAFSEVNPIYFNCIYIQDGMRRISILQRKLEKETLIVFKCCIT